MTQPRARAGSPAWHVGKKVKRWRKDAGFTSQQALADRLVDLGVPTTREVIANIESHRREDLTLDEVFGLALALNTSPTNLLLPDDDTELVSVTPVVEDHANWVRRWIYGGWRLRTGDGATPDDERLDADFHRRAPEYERRERSERFWRHPLASAIVELQGYARDAVLGPQEVVTPRGMSQALKRSADKVKRYADLLAEELKDQKEWDR